MVQSLCLKSPGCCDPTVRAELRSHRAHNPALVPGHEYLPQLAVLNVCSSSLDWEQGRGGERPQEKLDLS